MKTQLAKSKTYVSRVVSQAEWLVARKELLAKERNSPVSATR